MDIKLVHASITGKKISSFAQAVMEIFNFFLGCVTFGPPCSLIKLIIRFMMKISTDSMSSYLFLNPSKFTISRVFFSVRAKLYRTEALKYKEESLDHHHLFPSQIMTDVTNSSLSIIRAA